MKGYVNFLFSKRIFFACGWWGDFTKKSCNLMQTKQGLKVLVSSVPFTLSVVLLHVSKVDKHPPIYRAVLNTFSGWHGRNFWSKLTQAFNYSTICVHLYIDHLSVDHSRVQGASCTQTRVFFFFIIYLKTLTNQSPLDFRII